MESLDQVTTSTVTLGIMVYDPFVVRQLLCILGFVLLYRLGPYEGKREIADIRLQVPRLWARV